MPKSNTKIPKTPGTPPEQDSPEEAGAALHGAKLLSAIAHHHASQIEAMQAKRKAGKGAPGAPPAGPDGSPPADGLDDK